MNTVIDPLVIRHVCNTVAVLSEGLLADQVVAVHLETPHGRYSVKSLRGLSEDTILVTTRESESNTPYQILISPQQAVFVFSFVRIPDGEDPREIGFHVAPQK